jgi:NADPH:quinone reductase
LAPIWPGEIADQSVASRESSSWLSSSLALAAGVGGPMKAVRYHKKGGPEVLVYEDVPDPVPGPGQILIRVLASGINYADTVRRSGDHYPMPTPLPFCPGGEVVGVVEELGGGITGISLGETVMGWIGNGGYAERAVVGIEQVIRIPEGIAPVASLALIVQGLTASLALKQSAGLIAGESVLIQAAAGGVGVLAVQLARLYGAGTVIGVASTAEKRRLVKSLGADAAIDYLAPDWPEAVKIANGGKGVDLILAMTGGRVFAQSFACLVPFGRMVVYGNANHESQEIAVEQQLIPTNRTVTGFFLGGYIGSADGRRVIAEHVDELGALVRAGKLRLEIGGQWKLAEAAAAHRAMEARETSGKLVLIP